MVWCPPEDCTSIVHLNVQGLNSGSRTKNTDIQMDKEIQKVDILFLTETHFEDIQVVDVKNFWKEKKGELYHNDRKGRKGRGVIIAVSGKFISNQIEIDSQLEVVGVEVYCASK